jgi:hypothetical protein
LDPGVEVTQNAFDGEAIPFRAESGVEIDDVDPIRSFTSPMKCHL